MTPAQRADAPLEGGWVVEGRDGSGAPLRLVFGETEMRKAYLGIAVGRHPALCERVIDDPTVSRRHLRIGIADGRPFVEDLNSLNGTLLDGAEIEALHHVSSAHRGLLLSTRSTRA